MTRTLTAVLLTGALLITGVTIPKLDGSAKEAGSLEVSAPHGCGSGNDDCGLGQDGDRG